MVDVSIDATLKKLFGDPTPEWFFWGLLAAYWIVLTAWDYVGAVEMKVADNESAISKRWPKAPNWFGILMAHFMDSGRIVAIVLFVAAAIWAAKYQPSPLIAQCLFGFSLLHQVAVAIVFDAGDTP